MATTRMFNGPLTIADFENEILTCDLVYADYIGSSDEACCFGETIGLSDRPICVIICIPASAPAIVAEKVFEGRKICVFFDYAESYSKNGLRCIGMKNILPRPVLSEEEEARQEAEWLALTLYERKMRDARGAYLLMSEDHHLRNKNGELVENHDSIMRFIVEPYEALAIDAYDPDLFDAAALLNEIWGSDDY